MDHRIVIDYQGGGYEARCACGGWEKELIPARVGGLREVYDRIRCDHRGHVEQAEGEAREPAVA